MLNNNKNNGNLEERMMETMTRPRLSRRDLLKSFGAATVVAMSGAIVHPGEGWAMEATALKPETMRTLVKMARDTYPHDQLADRFYAVAMKSFDTQAASDAAFKAMVEDGVIALDTVAQARHGVAYVDVGWEIDRVALLKEMEDGTFFQKVRGNLVTGLYNNEEVWPIFGYQGESASKGGYINRGFDDIAWL
jgi:hypothetical protein